MTVEVMKPENVGTPFSPNVNVSRGAFEHMCAEVDGHSGALVHALKFGVRWRLLESCGELGRDLDLCVGQFYCEYAASQWRRWSSIVQLSRDGVLSNGWDHGIWHTAHHAMAVRLILEWDQWPADVAYSQDDGMTWSGYVLGAQPGTGMGWFSLERIEFPVDWTTGVQAMPQHIGVYTAVHWHTIPVCVEEFRVHRGGLLETGQGSLGSWHADGGILSLVWDPDSFHSCVTVMSPDGGRSWFGFGDSAGLRLARRSGRTLESLDVIQQMHSWEVVD